MLVDLVIDSDPSKRSEAEAISATAVSKAAALALEGCLKPLTLRTNWSAAASISAGSGAPSARRSVLMLLHTP